MISNYKFPEGAPINEAANRFAETPLAQTFKASAASDEVFVLLSYIDWHSRITLGIDACDGSAGFSRNGRPIRICDANIRKFENQLAN